ncbi:MAG: bifunctional pyr operon transcriptional regulator/uracil phosphoribosyltransferase PyrR [Candidatus Altiarchaeota archaeon]
MKKQVLNHLELRECVKKVTEEIIEENANLGNVVLVGILTRGATLAGRIQKAIKEEARIELHLGVLDTRPYRDDRKDGSIEDRTDIPFPITGKDVILVDDVMSTGRTIRAAMDALIKFGRPRSIKTAALIDRGHRELPITADYVGTQIPTSVKEKIKVRLTEVDGGKDRADITTE